MQILQTSIATKILYLVEAFVKLDSAQLMRKGT